MYSVACFNWKINARHVKPGFSAFLFILRCFCYYCRAAELLELSHVRLDREQIGEIDNLDCLGPVTNLYLQKVRSFSSII